MEFDARLLDFGGGIDNDEETITFTKPHSLKTGEAIVYNPNGNNALGIGDFKGSNTHQGTALGNGSVYYASVVNSTTIRLFNSQESALSGINTVGLTTTSQGLHKFRMFNGRQSLKSLKVLEPGSKYQNRKLKVKPENISTIENSITFPNHGFGEGDRVIYSYDGVAAGGLSTETEYKVLKVSDDIFKLADVSIGATVTEFYDRRFEVDITSTGSDFHNFSYLPITVTINAGLSTTGSITATPIVRGEIVQVYLHESGTGYGSTVLNFEKTPTINVKSGKGAEIKPVVIGGSILGVQVTNGGSEYTSAPDLTVTGEGLGAKLRAVISGGKVTSVVILESGSGYNQNTTDITVTSVGRNGFIDCSVRGLRLNTHNRFGDEILLEKNGELGYGMVGYTTSIGLTEFDDDGEKHSPIIGWAYDGNPIYGAYGYTDPNDIDSDLKILTGGYESSTTNIVDRPANFPEGFFVEDYKYTSSDTVDLDEHGGRYEKTPEFPEGVYAYHASITSNGLSSKFPFFVGNTYRSLVPTQNLDQSYDFNNSTLKRNTFPYKVADKFANNDFIVESYETLMQTAEIESVNEGSVDSFTINVSGSDYKVNDVATFDNTGTEGGGLSAYVDFITGKEITDISTTVETFQSVVLERKNQDEVVVGTVVPHGFNNGDKIVISGLSTFISGLTKPHIIGVTSETTKLVAPVPANAVVGLVTDIFVLNIPSSISVGTTVSIGTERASVLGTYPENKVIRIYRDDTSSPTHGAGTTVSIIPNTFTLPVNTDYFESSFDDKVFFNSVQSVGVGTTTGGSASNQYFKGSSFETISVPFQSIYLPNHPFKTGQQVTFSKEGLINNFAVSDGEDTAQFNIPQSGDTETLFVIKKSDDYIGLCTLVGLTTYTDGLYYRDIQSHGDSRDYRYSLESNKTQVTARAEKIKANISVSTAHSLSDGDTIKLSLTSNQSVGIGTSVAVRLKYYSDYDRLVTDPVGFNSTAVDTSLNRLTLTKHGLKTKDKVFYDASDLVVSGLSTGTYYVYRIDDDTISLSKTFEDVIAEPPVNVSFASTGGASQELYKVNPQLKVIRDNNLVFDLTDSSLSGYTLKLFYDNAFKNEFVSSGSTNTFSSVGFATVGVSTNASLTLNYDEGLPEKLYYQLYKSGYISTADTHVVNYSEILFVDSAYNGTYSISGVGTTSFSVALNSVPEYLGYGQTQINTMKYSTSSKTASGGVESLRVTYAGANYKKLPEFVSIASTTGKNADIIPT